MTEFDESSSNTGALQEAPPIPSLVIFSEGGQSEVAEVDESPKNNMVVFQNAPSESELEELLKKDQISPEHMTSYLNMLRGHYVETNGYDDDILAALEHRWAMCLIMSCLRAQNSEDIREWLQEIADNEMWPSDHNLPLSPGKLASLRYFSQADQLRFTEIQRKFCGHYKIGQHTEIVKPLLLPFYADDTPLGDGTFAIVETVKLVHNDGSKGTISYARKRARHLTLNSILEEELETLQNLNCHHHVVQCVGSYRYNEYTHILLSPRAGNGNLSKYLEGSLSKRKTNILKMSFGCLMSGLAFLSAKMRHKDIKPENILVDKSRVLFTDFGSAYNFGKGELGAATSHTYAGNVNWMYSAPEVHQLNGNRDVKTDLFSLGCVFAEIIAVLSGKSITDFHKIINGDNPSGIRYAYRVDQLHNWLDELRTTNPKLSMPIDWCKEMTQKERVKRPKISVLIQEAKAQCHSNSELDAYFCSDCLKQEGNGGELDNAEVNKSDNYGLTRLSVAAAQRNKERVKRLLNANADAKIKDPNEEGTSLHWAAEGGDPGTIRLILEKSDVDVNAKSRTHGTPLSWAVQKKFLDAVRVLLSFKADVNSKNPTGSTPLHLAAQGGDAGLVSLLIRHGADIAETDDKGRTALALAEEGGNEEVAALLRAAIPDDATSRMAVGSGGSGGNELAKNTQNESLPYRPILKKANDSPQPNSRPTSPRTRFADQEEVIKDIQTMRPESPEEE